MRFILKNNIDIYFVHLFNDFSGSPRVLKDVIDLKLNPKGQTFVMFSLLTVSYKVLYSVLNKLFKA